MSRGLPGWDQVRVELQRAVLGFHGEAGERVLREIERRRAGAVREDGLLPRSVLLEAVTLPVRSAFPDRAAELLVMARRAIWPHGVADGTLQVEGGDDPALDPVALEHDVFPSLTLMDGPQSGMVLLLDRTPFAVGRSRAGDVDASLDHVSVSRRQAVFERDALGRFCVRDLGSTSGTFVGGRNSHGATPLPDGELLHLGALPARFLAAIPRR